VEAADGAIRLSRFFAEHGEAVKRGDQLQGTNKKGWYTAPDLMIEGRARRLS